MKPTAFLRRFLAIAGSAVLTISYSHAATLYWDSNTTTAGAGATPTGTWGTSNFWNTDSTGGAGGAFQTPTLNTDDLFFVAAPGAASGNNAYVVTVSGAQVANSLTFQASGGTTLSGGTSITLGNGTPASGGITMNQFAYGSTAQGAVTISTALILNNSQTWTNNSASLLTFGAGGVSLGANTLTFSGTGNFSAGAGTFGNAGTGGIIMNGTGVLNLRVATNMNYTGSTTINSGVVLLNAGSKSTGNFNLNGGMVTDYFQQTGVFSSGLGTGTNQIQIYGNSGFGAGNGTSTWRIGTAGSVLIWGASGEGAATGFFNPTTLKFMTPADNLGPSIYGIVNFDNGINLNGVARTINVLNASANPTNSGAQIAGVISNGSLIKTGGGNLTLSNAGNTYAGTTTISAGFLTVAASGALGSVSNSLEFNGGTLRATGTITSPSTRSVTMTSTGIIDNNGQAISIAGNIGGAGGLTKNGAGTLTLSGTNSYGGVTTVNVGTLAIAKEASLYNGTPANWTADKINVKTGTTLALNVDSAGTAGFTSANLGTLLGNISVANTATQGLQGRATLALDTTTATGATFTQGNAIANSTSGLLNLTKLGTGTLVLNQTNTYSGATTITAGTLNANASAALGDSSVTNTLILNGGTLQAGGTITSVAARGVSVTANSTIDTNGNNISIAGNVIGSGTLTKSGAGTLTLSGVNSHTGTTTVSAGTLTLSDALALQTSALVTTGAGTVTLSGVTAPTLGGLSGASGNLSTIISNYNTVTGLTLNPQSGSITYSGSISDGTVGMTLTKTGVGTQILSGANTYTGLTTIKGGILQVTGSINGTTGTALTFGGSSTFDVKEAASSTQGMGALTFSVGEGSILSTAAGATSTATLTFASLAARAAGATGDFRLVTNLTASQNKIVLTSNTNAPLDSSGSNNQGFFFGGSEFARYDTTNGYFRAVTYGTDSNASAIVAGGATLGINDATKDVKISAAITAQTTAAVNTLNLGAQTFTFSNAANIFSVNGILSSGSTTGAINNTTTVSSIQSTTDGGEIVIRVNGSTDVLSIAPKIQNFSGGSLATKLTKSGAGILVLNGLNTYTGDTFINGGTLRLGSNNTANGANLNGGNYAGNVFLGSGATLDVQTNANQTLSGVISGDGNIVKRYTGTLTLSGNNTYTGKTSIVPTNTPGGGASAGILSVSSFNSVFTNATLGTVHSATSSLGAPTTVANGTIDFGTGSVQATAQITYTGGGEITDRVINFQFNGNSSRTFDTSGTVGTLLKFTSTPTANATTSNTITLQGTSNGEFVGGLPFAFAGLTKSGSGTWSLGGNVGVAGTTTISNSGGTLQINGEGSFNNGSYAQAISIGTSGRLRYSSSINQTLSGVISGAGALTKDTSSTSTLTLTNTNTYNGATTISAGTLAVTGTGSINNSAVTVNGGTFRYNSSVAYSGALTFTSGTIAGTNLTGTLGNQTIGAGKTIAPGNSPGTATTTTQTWAGGGSYAWEINDVNSGAGADPGWDLINGSGTLTITATSGSQFNLLLSSLALSNAAGVVHDFNSTTSYNWLIADFASISGFAADAFNINTTGFTNTFTGNFGVSLGGGALPGDNTQIYLTYTYVPEPGAALIGSLGLLALLRRRRN